MKSTRTNWPVFTTCCVLSGALGLTGCGGSKSTKVDGSAGPLPDGTIPSADGMISDTPMGAGGWGGSGGYDGPPNAGGSSGAVRGGATGTGGATGVDANTSKNDSALGGAGGTTGAGGAAGSSGAGGGVVGSGSAGRGGTSGTGGAGGNGGSTATDRLDAGREVANSSRVDANGDPPICSFSTKDTPSGTRCSELGFTGTCRDSQTPHVCVCPSYMSSFLQCSSSCPETAAPGGECLFDGQMCFYESLGQCQCKVRLVGDASRSYSFSCSRASLDAGPPDTAPDARKSVFKNVPCSEQPGFGECTPADGGRMPGGQACGPCKIPDGVGNYSCALEDGKSACSCGGGYWACGTSACPDDARELDPCDQQSLGCLNTQGQVCYCFPLVGVADGPVLVFRCTTLDL
jgi:hypothetical protein